MTASERRYRRHKKIQSRQRIINQSGLRGGTLYEKHREKIQENNGYLAKHGTVLHYANGTKRPTQKTRDRDSFAGTNNWQKKDSAQLQSMDEDLKEYYAK